MKTFCYIFARGGSKGLPKKNIKPFIKDVDVEKFFSETLDKLISAYGDRLLEIDVKGLPVQPPSMHG